MDQERLLDVVVAFAEAQGWSGQRDDEHSIYSCGFSGDSGQWTSVVYAIEADRRLVVYAVSPLRCPQPRRTAMMELITRANYDMVIGNFEMDLSDGEIRFKTSVDVEGDRLSTVLLRNLLVVNHQMMDRYLPALIQVIAGSASPADAVAAVETPPQ